MNDQLKIWLVLVFKGFCHLTEACLSIQLWIFGGIFALYWHHHLTPDWVFASMLGMLVAFRQAQGLIVAWKGMVTK